MFFWLVLKGEVLMASRPVHLRPATVEDAPAIGELSDQLGYPDPSKRTEGRLVFLLGEKDHAILVACLADESVVGWIHVFVAHRLESDAFAELGGFVVAENQRGRGIGRLLLLAAEKWVLERDLEKLRVRSRSERDQAQGFYRRLGFQLSKEQHVFDKKLDPDT